MIDVISSWGKKPFQFTMVASVQFVILTIIAMWFYPGGTSENPSSEGYDFFRNFFSTLGLTVANNGETNTISFVLFVIALSLAGLGLVIFFIAEPQFFTSRRSIKILSLIGSIFGILSGLSYIGVALTPANLLPEAHGLFTLNAFRLFLVAVIFYLIAIVVNNRYLNIYAVVYFFFAVLLALYIYLMMQGPSMGTPEGLIIQAAGQKIIAYASIICMFIQGYGATKQIETDMSSPT
jgi:hypothetical protein